MDILNWIYLVKSKFIKTTIQDKAKDLVILGNNVSFDKRGDKYQSYGMSVTDFANQLPVVTQIVAGTNVTISPAGGTGAVTVNASGGGGNVLATHILSKPQSGFYYSNALTQGNLQVSTHTQNVLIPTAFTPAYNLTINTFIIEITTLAVGGLAKIAIYSDLNGVPHTKLLESADVSTDTTGTKTITGFSFSFTAGTTYWIAVATNSPTAQFRVMNSNALMLAPVIAASNSTQVYTSWFISALYASLPSTLTTPTTGNLNHSSVPYLIFRAV